MMLYGAFLFRNRDVAVLPVCVSIAMMLVIATGFMTAHQDWTEIFPNAFDVWSAWGDLTYMWLPEHAFAQSISPTLKLTTIGNISDNGQISVRILGTFESSGRTYAAVASHDNDGVQILDLTDPYNVTAAGGIADTDDLDLGGAWDIATFESDGRTYGAVTLYKSVQILDLTDPYNVTAAGGIADTDDLELGGAWDIVTFESDGRTYAAVTSSDDDGVQILDLTDPYNVTAAGSIADYGRLYLGGAWDVATFESDGRAYAAVASYDEEGVQILDLTDPYNVTAAGGIAYTDDLDLGNALDIVTFESDGRAYAAVASPYDEVVQILDLTDPYNITAAGSITDDDSLYLGGAHHIATFESDDRTYAAVASPYDEVVQILDLTDPYNITAAGSITDDDSLYLGGAWDVATLESDGRAYAAVASYDEEGVQILDLTDPYNITAAGGIADYDRLYLGGAHHIATFESDDRTYAAVASDDDDGVQILDLTDPYSVTAADGITDIEGASHVTVFESDGRTYAAVVLYDGVQILDLTDPYSVTVAGSITDEDDLDLEDVRGITTFESGERAYAAVIWHDGVQILDLTNPHNVTTVGGIADTDDLDLGGAWDIATFESGGRTYAAVSSYYDGVQILDLTDPYNVTAAGSIADYDRRYLDGARHIATFESGSRTYAAVMLSLPFHYDIQILDLTDPYNVTAADGITDIGDVSHVAVFESDGRTYAAVALHSGGIRIFDLTDPYDITLAGGSSTAYGDFHGITSITTFELDGNTYVATTSPYQGVQTLQLATKEPDACVGHTADAAAPAIPPEIAVAGNRFAVDLYGQVSGDGDNVFFSPVSVYVAFSMVGEAARGETVSQLQGVFGFEPDDELRHNATATLVSSLNQPDPCATLQLANSLWLAEQFEPYDSYIGVVGDAYQADIETVDFMDGGVDRINGWASEKTQGKIPKVLDPDSIPENMTTVILNAIYFKGTWEEPFPTGNTHESDFWTGTQEVKADFMSMTTRFGYAESDGVQVLRMPYQGDRLSMLVMLPSDRDGLDHLERIVTSELIEGWQESLRTTLVSALVPKFEMDTHYNLIPPLVNMGVKDVFDPHMSDLSGMAHLEPHERLYVNIAIQDAYVKVNEEGTEAAAVTTIGGGIATSLPPEPVPFIADHPFLFLIQDDKSGMILFMGRVSDPS